MKPRPTDDELLEEIRHMDRDWVMGALAQLMADFVEAGIPPAEIYSSVKRVCDRVGIDVEDIKRAGN
ncbi:hypothetical protein WDZ92_35000 [Nostoc sp. NIES-2111]